MFSFSSCSVWLCNFVLWPLSYPWHLGSLSYHVQGQKSAKADHEDWRVNWQPLTGWNPAQQPSGHVGFSPETRSTNWLMLWNAGSLTKFLSTGVCVCMCEWKSVWAHVSRILPVRGEVGEGRMENTLGLAPLLLSIRQDWVAAISQWTRPQSVCLLLAELQVNMAPPWAKLVWQVLIQHARCLWDWDRLLSPHSCTSDLHFVSTCGSPQAKPSCSLAPALPWRLSICPSLHFLHSIWLPWALQTSPACTALWYCVAAFKSVFVPGGSWKGLRKWARDTHRC